MEDNLGATTMSTESNRQSTEAEPIVDHQSQSAQPRADWVTLSQFVVQINKQSEVNAQIYANGRQQVPIEVIIQARDKDGVAVNLTQEQLKGIRLIEYETEKAVADWSHKKNDLFVYEWPLTRDDGAEVEPDAEPSETPEATAQPIMIYVKKTDATTTWIAAEITSPSGGIFRTNTPNPPAGKFDSWVKLHGRPPKVTNWEQFVISVPKRVVANSDWEVMLYYIYFADPNSRIVASINYQELKRGVHFTIDQYARKRVEQIAFVVGPQVSYVHRSGLSNDRYTTFTINDRSGQANAARVSDFTSMPYGYWNHQNGLMGYIDQHGNESKITLKAIADGGQEGVGGAMRLDDPANVHDESPSGP